MAVTTSAELSATMNAYADSHPERCRCTPYREFSACCAEWFGPSPDPDEVLTSEFVEYWMDVVTGDIDLNGDTPPNWPPATRSE
jgi:hypothetical protein